MHKVIEGGHELCCLRSWILVSCIESLIEPFVQLSCCEISGICNPAFSLPSIVHLRVSLWILLWASGRTTGGLGETLYSFAGDDVLTGAGSSDFDTFYYRADLNAGGWGDDSITDFVDGNDLIVLDGYGWNDYSDFLTAGGSISDSTISYAGDSIDVAFAGGGTLDSSDLIFVA